MARNRQGKMPDLPKTVERRIYVIRDHKVMMDRDRAGWTD
jgi:hypothetical protein